MNHLIQHIEYLILKHECVIVPGLGAFISSITSARIDEEKGILLPPCRSIMFNQAVSTDDGLLTNSIARKSNLSFEEARQVLFHKVTSLKQTLLSEGSLSLGKIGNFILGEENTILFTPSSANDSLSLFPGLKEVAYSINKKSSPLSENITSKKNIPFIRKFGKFAAAVTLAIVVACAAIFYPLPSDQREQKASVVPVDAIFVKKGEDKPIVTKPVTDTVISTQQKEILPAPRQPKHYLIVATFVSSQEAEAFAEKYSSSDYPLSTVSSRKVTRVAAAVSDDKEILQAKLNSKDFSSHFSNSWIWTEEI